MAGKAKVGAIKDSTGGGDGSGSTIVTGGGGTVNNPPVSGTGSVPGGPVASPPGTPSGTAIISITDIRTGQQFDFEQPNYMGLDLNVGDIVKYDTIIPAGTKTPVVVSASRLNVGVVASVTSDKTGTLTERVSKKTIAFFQTNLNDLGIKAGAHVAYDLVPGANGTEVAVNLNNQD